MRWHRWSGYALLTLLLFRLYWGFFGSSSARFVSFVMGPQALRAHARELFRPTSGKPVLGHNPIGGWSVITLLVLMLLQVGFGLFSVDVDGIESGPLSYLVTFDLGRKLATLHGQIFNILLGFIVIHILAVIFYLVYKKSNLIAPMVTGRMSLPAENGPLEHATFAPLSRALVGLSLALVITWCIVSL